MSDDLFFLPIIAQALQQPSPERALEGAFAKIKDMGQKPQYSRGFEQ